MTQFSQDRHNLYFQSSILYICKRIFRREKLYLVREIENHLGGREVSTRASSINVCVFHFKMDRLRYWRHQPSPPSYQLIYYSFDGKKRYMPSHHSKMGPSKTFQYSYCRYIEDSVLSLMWCPKCKHKVARGKI